MHTLLGTTGHVKESITVQQAQSVFGSLWLARTSRGICQLEFLPDNDTTLARRALASSWPGCAITERKEPFDLAGLLSHPQVLDVHGTPFQLLVWSALLAIPFGQTRTYGEIASIIGSPRAYRAVGAAVGRNPVAILIPCHRVLAANGKLGGFYWGPDLKRCLLAAEGIVV